ncbi:MULTISPECIES: ferrous iron transport protein B [Anoxybacillus]|uniref:Ferrous iron transport protein B n=1 Tax=Anoxybacillus ayderensis TaxID=265546 RepID=A0A0D0HNG6_9BACL|nr:MULTISPECIES: ferrous iron transport protein B [Anoxybacillus]EPZ39526.1 Fe2+ transport system protein B [Anoxybacillus ayderensis]KIP20777.1 Ferrous iron transport protein B [Anoxybacillus ayderensis]NNU97135.1 ferrous iron transport protein B [Anoxybacillus sp. EFIL]
MMHIALVGNPNTGKTSLFNQLTGTYEYVGNWSGVTVEKKVGVLRNKQAKVIDLPGVYSLHPLSRDERVVTQFLLTESFDEMLNIVDASQLERNLLLTVQLLEFGKPLAIALNMVDVAERRGIFIDQTKLATMLRVPVVPVVARTGKGCDQVEHMLLEKATEQTEPLTLFYGGAMERAIERFRAAWGTEEKFPVRWLAIQFYEGNSYVRDYVAEKLPEATWRSLYEQAEKEVQQAEQMSLAQLIYERRRSFVKEIIEQSVQRKEIERVTLTERIDAVVTNKYVGIPIFLLAMYVLFQLTFDWIGAPLSDLLDAFFAGPLTDSMTAVLKAIGASEFIRALIVDGIIAGVGGVLVFVPQIFILFFFISFLEDSGYMARVALVMDRLMEAVGLNGKAFIPLIIGFGCNVPGVMAARTIEQPRERLVTMLLTPLMSCSARLPVYALFVGAFFATHQALVVLSLYVLGVSLALILAKLFSLTILKEESSVFVVELPPYRMPQWQALWRSTWDKGKGFVKKAGTFIFGGSVAIWLLSYVGPHGVNVNMDDSFLAMIGSVLAPLLAPLGFGTWQAGAALLTGFLAKEVVVSTMNIIYHVPDVESLQGLMASHFTALSAFSFMVFVLLYVPCLATVATIYKETRSRKWTMFSIGYALVLAYIVSFVIYQAGSLFGF